ncbi:hypothetical protein [Alistipes shahii]|uniref:hypothetical protein n=1 Tax=Alistipes shahii TaxID=328814 RepID=UPI00266C834E|nr:hypothetical protein [Alistipes shahii]
MDRLLRTSLYRALLKSPTRKVVSENRLRNYFHDFAQQVTAIGDDTDALSALRILNYTHVQFHSLLRRVSEQGTPPPHYLSRFIVMTIEFIRMEKELLYYRLEHPQYFISGSAPQSPLYWSKEHSAISVSEILCGLDRMTPKPLLLADGTAAPFNLVVRVFEDTLHVKLGDPTDVKRRVLERKKDRTKFTEALLYSLNREE